MRWIIIILLNFYALNLDAQSYSGLWMPREDPNELYAEVFINLKQRTDGSVTGELCYYGTVYDFVSSKIYKVNGKSYKTCHLVLTKKDGKSVHPNNEGGCKLLLYNDIRETNRMDFINDSNTIAPNSIYNMYNSDVATQNAIAGLQEDQKGYSDIRKEVIKRAKEFFIATANGNVSRLKQLMTPELYNRYYPYSDDKVRGLLLSMPYKRRKNMVDAVYKHSDVTTIVNGPGDVVTVIFSNRINNKIITFQLGDEYGTGDWRIFSYYH